MVVPVVGMHRSGTSALASALPNLGVYLGGEDVLLKPSPNDVTETNTRGFFEHKKIVATHEKTLAALNMTYDSVGIPPLGWEQRADIRTLAADLEHLVEESLAPKGAWGFKDPRVCRLFALWRTILDPRDTRVLLCVRNPKSVVASLKKRNGLSAARAAQLWLCHVLPAVLDTAHFPQLVVDYDRLVENPTRELSRVQKFLGSVGASGDPNVPNDLIDPAMRHNLVSIVGDAPNVPPLLDHLYGLLLAAAKDQLSIGALVSHFQEVWQNVFISSGTLDFAREADRITAPAPTSCYAHIQIHGAGAAVDDFIWPISNPGAIDIDRIVQSTALGLSVRLIGLSGVIDNLATCLRAPDGQLSRHSVAPLIAGSACRLSDGRYLILGNCDFRYPTLSLQRGDIVNVQLTWTSDSPAPTIAAIVESLDALSTDNEALRSVASALAQTQLDLTDTKMHLKRAESWAADLRQQLAERTRKLEETCSRLASAQSSLAAAEVTASEVHDQLLDRAQICDELKARLASVEHALADTTAKYQDSHALASRLAQQVDSLARDVDAVLSSRSWRLMAPYRTLGTMAKTLVGKSRHRLLHLYRRLPARAKTFVRKNIASVGQGAVASVDAALLYKAEFQTRAGKLGGPDFIPHQDWPPISPDIRAIAFYLPQFHPIPENDANWEPGFTEWTNVTKAVPQFVGHYQPQLPIDVGFYDLRVVEVLRRQAEIARNYGISGFAFHHYWFDGRPVMNTPIMNMLANPDIDFPFCIHWANENWTRRWDGQDDDVILAQRHSPEDDIAFIADAVKYLKDPRYIRVDGKALLIVYRPSLFPNAKDTACRWREYCREAGLGELYLVLMHAFDNQDPRELGFDAAIEYPPNLFPAEPFHGPTHFLNADFSGNLLDYASLPAIARQAPKPSYERFRGVCPAWDNEPRRPGRGTIFVGSTPALYEEWLRFACEDVAGNAPEHRLVFINAWNEWAEGAHLEPDRKYGYAYLQATRRALVESSRPFAVSGRAVVVVHDAHPHGAQYLALNVIKTMKETYGVKVATLLLEGGQMTEEFARESDMLFRWWDLSPQEQYGAIQYLAASGYRKALCNTVVTGDVAYVLRDAGFDVVGAVHEMEGLIREKGLTPAAANLRRAASHLVVPSKVVAKSFLNATSAVPGEPSLSILPQGIYKAFVRKGQKEALRRKVRRDHNIPDSATMVLNVGYGDHRKGLDIFVNVLRLALARNLDWHFVWLGNVDLELWRAVTADMPQAQRDHLHLIPFTDDVEPCYYAADIFFLSSREDPFPSVVLEACNAGLPVVGFQGTGGFVDLFDDAYPYLVPMDDGKSALAALSDLAADTLSRRAVGTALETRIQERYYFPDYVHSLLALMGIPAFRVSVVLPNYNYGRFLQERLASIAHQTLRPYELIFIDDASSDDSRRIAEAFADGTTLKCRLVAHTANQGCFHGWAEGIALAQGDLIWIAEADDFAHARLLENLVGCFEDPSVNVAYCDSYVTDDESRVAEYDYRDWTNDVSPIKWSTSYKCDGRNEVRVALSIKNTIPNASAVIFRASALAGIDGQLRQFQISGDWFSYGYALVHGSICFVNKRLNYHRRHSASNISRQAASYGHLNEHIRVLKFMHESFQLSAAEITRALGFLEAEYRKLIGTQVGIRSIWHDPQIAPRLRAAFGTFEASAGHADVPLRA